MATDAVNIWPTYQAGLFSAQLTQKTQAKNPGPYGPGFFFIDAWQFPTLTWGDPTLPSALRRFTSEFGMGSGGTTALKPPGKFCYQHASLHVN